MKAVAEVFGVSRGRHKGAEVYMESYRRKLSVWTRASEAVNSVFQSGCIYRAPTNSILARRTLVGRLLLCFPSAAQQAKMFAEVFPD